MFYVVMMANKLISFTTVCLWSQVSVFVGVGTCYVKVVDDGQC